MGTQAPRLTGRRDMLQPVNECGPEGALVFWSRMSLPRHSPFVGLAGLSRSLLFG